MGGVSFLGRIPRLVVADQEGYAAFSSFTHLLRLPQTISPRPGVPIATADDPKRDQVRKRLSSNPRLAPSLQWRSKADKDREYGVEYGGDDIPHQLT